jgi:hypothetical protein
MLFYDILGSIPKKKKFETYIDNILNEFFPKGIKSQRFVKIKFKVGCDNQVAGYCFEDEEGDITVEIAKSSNGQTYHIEEIALHLAHELVHVKQYIQGKMDRDLSIPYDQQPSEIEAYALESVLFEKYWNK